MGKARDERKLLLFHSLVLAPTAPSSVSECATGRLIYSITGHVLSALPHWTISTLTKYTFVAGHAVITRLA